VKANLSVDRLSLLLPIHPHDIVPLTGMLTTLKLQPQLGGADGIVVAGFKAKQGSHVALHVKVPTSTEPLIWSHDTAALIQVKPGQGGKASLRIEFMPLALTPQGFTHVFERVLRQHLFLEPEDLLPGKVTRVDMALDLHGVRLEDYSWRMPGRQVAQPWTRNGDLETLYLGSPKRGAACLYDKGKQQKQDPTTAWTRVELRPKPLVPLGSLPNLPNALAKVQVDDVLAACEAVGTPTMYRRMALDTAHLRGLKRLLLRFDNQKGPGKAPSHRDKFEKALVETQPAWWQPEAFWSAWPAALAHAMPLIFGDV
jgi:hypothetical protein